MGKAKVIEEEVPVDKKALKVCLGRCEPMPACAQASSACLPARARLPPPPKGGPSERRQW